MFFEKFNYITKSEPLRFAPSTLVNIHYIVYDVIIFLSTPVKIVTFIVKFSCNFQLPSLITTFISVKIIIFILNFMSTNQLKLWNNTQLTLLINSGKL